MQANRNLTPVWIIYSDGRRLDVEHEGALQSIRVDDSLNGIGTFSLVFNMAENKIKEAGFIGGGSRLSIYLGYKDDVEEVFSGEVREFYGFYPEMGGEYVEVIGNNVLYKLHHSSHFRSFEGKAPSEVIRGVIDAYSLKAEVEDFGTPKLFQPEEEMTDYEYLMGQARAYGKQVYANDTTIHVKNEISIRSDEVIYEWGKSLVSLKAKQTGDGLLSSVDYIGREHLANKSFVDKATLNDIPVKIGGLKSCTEASTGGRGSRAAIEVDLSSEDSEEAKQLAIGMLQCNSYGLGYAYGVGEGNYKLRPGMRVTLKMVSETYEGEHMAEKVVHRFDRRNGYTVEFDLKRNMCP
jgi:hypothetical protein